MRKPRRLLVRRAGPLPRLARTSVPGATRCFRTDPAGRIALIQDWPRLLAAARELPRIAWQCHHASARLLSFETLPELAWGDDGTTAADADGRFILPTSRWGLAWARISRCACCESPGWVGMHDVTGREFLRFNAPPGCPPELWADFLDPLRHRGEPVLRRPPTVGFPTIEAVKVAGAAQELTTLLSALRDERVALVVELATTGALRRESFDLGDIAVEGPLLAVRGPEALLQLALPAVVGLAVSSDADGDRLHALGPGETPLLALTATVGASARAVWHAALHAAFPELARAAHP